MSGTRGGYGRIVGMGVALAVALLLVVAGEAKAGKYAIAQCGWYVGADADWADTTGGAKFRQDGWCVPPAGQDPFDGAHLKSFTREGQSTVSGTRFARWRWIAPPTTGITQVRGTWWHALHDGMEQRIGVGNGTGSFDPFLAASSTDATPREFVAGFASPQPALEDRLLCARGEDKWCSLESSSWAGLRALTITVEDSTPPGAWITGGDLTDGGWRRGAQFVAISGYDAGAGVRFGETSLDGARVGLTEYPCAKASIGGEWRGTRMQPCLTNVSTTQTVATTSFSDGPHTLVHCTTDFAGNVACAPARMVAIDNNPPAHPRNLTLAGAEGWRRVDDFDISWSNPDQAPASPIAGAFWRITGPNDFDSGVKYAAGRDLSAIADRAVPRAGLYSFHIWLRDEAGNDAPGSAVEIPLRFDDVAPGVAFEPADSPSDSGMPDTIGALVTDAHSGPDDGRISYRRIDTGQWTELPTKTDAGPQPGEARLSARVPADLAAGTYLFRADARDLAGNVATTTRHADGTEMAVRKRVAVSVARKVNPARTKTRLFARLGWRRQRGPAATVPFGASATLSGRLLDADGAGLAGRGLRVVSRPSRGALVRPGVETVTTGSHGGFRLELGAGPSRRLTVNYPGDASLEPSRRPALALRVRGGVSLHAAPRTLRTGEVVHLGGRVRTLGAPLPRRGKLVAVQYYESAARRWRPMLVTRSDHSGRFHARYRFRYITGLARIALRAVALPEERWPYAPGASRPVTVRVTG
jgi:hypothetical protein